MRLRPWMVPPLAAAALALAASTGLADTQTVTDSPSDGRSGCEILRATAGHTASGRLRHTITVADAIVSKQYAPIVLIRSKPSEVGGGPKFILASTSSGVSTTLSADRKTVTYTIKPARLRSAMEAPRTRKSYYWSANGCYAHPDWAPQTGAGGERVRAHRFAP